MRGFFILIPALCAASLIPAKAQEAKTERLDSTVISATRANRRTPVTFTMVNQEELRSASPSRSLPEVLALQPSVVTYNEGGTGLGNSAMTVRGSKGSQINVTLNGITLNDQESQEVFWVNIPSLTAILSSVQLQRGLGTTANGSGAFGASINMSTASVGLNPTARFELSRGSWNTSIGTVSASTGLTPSGFYANAAYSKSYTDGYIRNAFVQSESAFVTLGWLKGNNSFRFTWLRGDQRSGITWDGIDYDMYTVDRRYNGAGEYHDDFGNVRYYDNQTDNYVQSHLQANYTHKFSEKVVWTSTLNYTRGDGYDEYYKENKKLFNYGFKVPVTGTDGNEHKRSDAIYQKKMSNDYWVLNSDLKFRSDRLNLTSGINLSYYHGDHWGEFLWAKVLGDSYDYKSMNSNRTWYFNDADKKEFDLFTRAEYRLSSNLTAYADVQLRLVSLVMEGRDDDFIEYGSTDYLDYDRLWKFFNPRAGLTWELAEGHKAYASLSLGGREPGRSDIKENIKGTITPIKPEHMLDAEMGYSFQKNGFGFSVNLYSMDYWNMLLETGRLSTSGYAIKDNVKRAVRRGIELAGAWNNLDWLRLDANLSLSSNRIPQYTSYVSVINEDWETTGETQKFDWGSTDILLSPSVVSMLRLAVTPFKNTTSTSLRTTTLTIDGKYVGRQYIDNTQRKEMEIPAWFVLNAGLSHHFDVHGGKLSLSAFANNVLNREYWAYGWRWESCMAGASKDDIISGIGVYPQATVNFMFKVAYEF